MPLIEDHTRTKIYGWHLCNFKPFHDIYWGFSLVQVARGDLQGLLRAAECLRIKGLAVPDEAPVKEELSPSVTESEGDPSPPRKRLRAEEVVSPPEITQLPAPQPPQNTTDFSSQYQDQENREFFDLQVSSHLSLPLILMDFYSQFIYKFRFTWNIFMWTENVNHNHYNIFSLLSRLGEEFRLENQKASVS